MAAASGLLTCVISIESFHVRRVKHYTVDFTVMIREISTIYTHGNVRGPDIVKRFLHLLPENTLAPCYVGYDCAMRDVQLKYLREHLSIPSDMSRSDHIAGGNTTLGSPSPSSFWRYTNLKLELRLNWSLCHVATLGNLSSTSRRWRCRVPRSATVSSRALSSCLIAHMHQLLHGAELSWRVHLAAVVAP